MKTQPSFYTFVIPLLVIGTIAVPAVAQPQQIQSNASPLIDQPAENMPNGSDWPQPTYERASSSAALQSRTRVPLTAATVGFGAGALVQPELPSGLVLGGPQTTRVELEPVSSVAGAQAQATPGGSVQPGTPTLSRNKFFITYPLAYNGVPLAKQSEVLAVVSEDGNLLYTRHRNLPQLVDATQPTVQPESAVELVRQETQPAMGSEQPQIAPPRLEVWVDPQLAGHLAWRVEIMSPALVNPVARRYWVSATGDPQVLRWESMIHHTHKGSTTGMLWSASPLGATENRPLHGLQVTRSTGGTAITSESGSYAFATGAGPANLQASLTGPYAVVENQAGPTLQATGSGSPGTPIELNYGASDEAGLAQVSAFYWINKAFDRTRSILGATDLARVPVRVNIASTCNAFWHTGNKTLNFFRAGGGCPNTAYADVALHEYGHGVDDYKGGILDGGYSEGFGDAIGLIETRQPCLGRDFFGAGTCLRPATDLIMWPPGPGDGVHSIGRRYAGFTWELIQQLRNCYSDDEAFDIAARLVLAAAAGNPSNIPDAVRLSFIADDNDNDLTNGSPHFRELAAAADSRNIPRPAEPRFAIQNRPVGAFAGWASDPVVRVLTGDFNGDGRTDIALVRQAGGWTTVPVALSGDANFAIQNRPVGAFAGWASDPVVRVLTGDFNGDGRTDIALVRQAGGWTTVPVALSGDANFAIQNRPVGDFAIWAADPNVRVLTGDFNGDGRTDIALVRQAGGWTTVPVALSSDTGFTIQNRPASDFALWASDPVVRVLTGDFNSDGRTDIALVRQAGGWTTVPVALSGDTGFTIQNRPASDFALWASDPVVRVLTGDFNSDGRTDIALVRQAGGWTTVPVALSGDTGFTIQNRPASDFALWASDPVVRVLTGDFNSDGRTDIALVRQAGGWTTVPVALSGDANFAIQNRPVGAFAGWASDPVVQVLTGDFNGDSRADIALVRQAGGWTTVPVALDDGSAAATIQASATPAMGITTPVAGRSVRATGAIPIGPINPAAPPPISNP